MEGDRILESLANDLLDLERLSEQEAMQHIQMEGSELSYGEKWDECSANAKSRRFVTVNDTDTTHFIEENRNKNTNYKTKSDIKIFSDWASSVGEFRPIETISAFELDSLLARFYLAVRKKDGSDYEPDTVSAIQNSLDRYLRDKKVQYSIKRDPAFSHSNRVLESKRKSLKSQGKGNKKLKADPLTKEEIDILYKNNLLGYDCPEKLMNTVWLNNGIYFGLRGRQDHTQLLWGDIELKKTSDGREYLEFNERGTKTRSGAKKSDFRKVTPKVFAVSNDYCPVEAYKRYAAHRPTDLMELDSRFYLQPLQNPSGIVWYSHQPVGKTKLGQMMNKLAEKGNLEGRKVNHSTRKTFASTLVQAGRPPTEVALLAGWKNVQTVNEYSVPSLEQQEKTSNILSDLMTPMNQSEKSEKPHAPVHTVSSDSTDGKENDDLLNVNSYNHHLSYSNKQNTHPFAFMTGATVSGGTININIFSGKRKNCCHSDSSQEN